MRKKLFQFTLIASILLLGACSNEEVLPVAQQTISFTADMPDDEPTTRVELNQDAISRTVKLTWKKGDIVKVAYVIGTTKGIIDAKAISTSNNGKTALFDLPFPTDVSGNITVSGVYGGGGIDNTDAANPKAILPALSNSATSSTLADVQNNKHVMLYFAPFTFTLGTTPPKVTFKHIGSLFSIKIKNTKASAITVTKAQLGGTYPNGDSKVIGVGSGLFNMVTGKLVIPNPTLLPSISFKAPATTLAAGKSMEFWAWYAPSETNWVNFNIFLYYNATYYYRTQSVDKGGQKALPGKAYYFYGLVNDNNEIDWSNKTAVN